MLKIFSKVLISAAFLASPLAAAQELTTNDIVMLSKSGIGDAAIIAKINDSATDFDLTPAQMVQLKDAGVSGPVMAAMLSGGSKDAQLQSNITSPDPMKPRPSGLYLLEEVSGPPKMVRMEPTISNQAKTGGVIGYSLTLGIASASVKVAIQNESAKVRTKAPTPVFFFFFDESNPDLPRQSSAWASGATAVTSSPNEFSLVRLSPKEGRREARVGSINIAGAKTGVMDKDRIAFTTELVRPGVYKVKPDQALPPGEYGFLFALAGQGTTGAMSARVFDFSVL